MLEQAIAWMELHDKLSGWAQAIGAAVALIAAFLVAHVQARYAARQEDRRTADRVRALSRTLRYWRDTCERSYALRKKEAQKPAVDELNTNLSEFNHIATEVNRFAFVDAPSDVVLRALIQYRSMCGPLSNFMNPGYMSPLPSTELDAFKSVIRELTEVTVQLLVEADRIAH